MPVELPIQPTTPPAEAPALNPGQPGARLRNDPPGPDIDVPAPETTPSIDPGITPGQPVA